jgi:hypothetical protein
MHIPKEGKSYYHVIILWQYDKYIQITEVSSFIYLNKLAKAKWPGIAPAETTLSRPLFFA